jgi:hypothetical protein
MATVSLWLLAERRNAMRIQRFEETQFLGSRWISFRRINEWHAKRPSDFPSYAESAAAILAGKFNSNGRSQILFLWVDNVVVERKGEAIVARPDFRFTVDDYRRAFHQAQPVLEAEYLSRFWIPRAVCSRWFQDEGYPLPHGSRRTRQRCRRAQQLSAKGNVAPSHSSIGSGKYTRT